MSPEEAPATATNPFDLPALSRSFSERSPHSMLAVEGPAHTIRYLNPAFARMAGKSPADLLGRPFVEAVPEWAGNGCLALLDGVYRTGVPERFTEQPRHSPGGPFAYAMWPILGVGERPVGVMIQVTTAPESASFTHWAQAVTEALMVSSVRQHELIETIRQGEQERRDLQGQLFQAQKLESLGVLAGGIAHDLNNMLTPILGYTDLASGYLPEGSPAAPLLDIVRSSTRRAADLMQQILGYAGKRQFVLRSLDLSDLVRETAESLGSAVSNQAVLVFELVPNLPFIEADASQLRRVVLSLVTNSAEAIGATSGTITVRTGSVPAADDAPKSLDQKTGRPSGPAVFLEVTDTGCGMTADVIEKIFEPFFTTKFTGRGLGLAVVQGIVRGHRGTLEVRSEPGTGSTVRVLLPCSTTGGTTPVVPRSLES